MILRIGFLHILLLTTISTLSYAEIAQVESVIYSDEYTENFFNEEYLSEFVCQKDIDAGILYIEFNYDSYNLCPEANIVGYVHQFRITLYDRNGNYLNHFITGEDIGEACTTVNTYYFRFQLAYSVAIRDLRDAEIVGLSFHQP